MMYSHPTRNIEHSLCSTTNIREKSKGYHAHWTETSYPSVSITKKEHLRMGLVTVVCTRMTVWGEVLPSLWSRDWHSSSFPEALSTSWWAASCTQHSGYIHTVNIAPVCCLTSLHMCSLSTFLKHLISWQINITYTPLTILDCILSFLILFVTD